MCLCVCVCVEHRKNTKEKGKKRKNHLIHLIQANRNRILIRYYLLGLLTDFFHFVHVIIMIMFDPPFSHFYNICLPVASGFAFILGSSGEAPVGPNPPPSLSLSSHSHQCSPPSDKEIQRSDFPYSVRYAILCDAPSSSPCFRLAFALLSPCFRLCFRLAAAWRESRV
jgi:hypothetical protein